MDRRKGARGTGVQDMRNNIGEARRRYESAVMGKFTQDDAAEFFGVSPSTYKKWEQGQGRLNGEILCQIADKYDTTVDYLLMVTDNPGPVHKYSVIRLDGPQNAPESLTADEKRLLEAYRALDENMRQAAIGAVEGMLATNRRQGDTADTVAV